MSKDISPTNRVRFIELGIKIGALRKMCGISQEQLAEKAKRSRSISSHKLFLMPTSYSL